MRRLKDGNSDIYLISSEIKRWTLPLPTRPQPWEDLASLLSRASAQMGYSKPAWILDPEEIPYRVRTLNLLLLSREADYTFLTQLLALDEEKLYELTLHRFATNLQPSELSQRSSSDDISRPLLSADASRAFINSLSSIRVCPLCLEEDKAYGRLYWNIAPVVACPLHNTFLIDRCPTCSRPVRLLRSSLTHCSRCRKGDYRRAQRTFVEQDQFLHTGYSFILKQLNIIDDGVRSDDPEFIKSPLVKLLPWQYFRLLDAFRPILGPLFPDSPLLRVSPVLRAQLPERSYLRRVYSIYEWAVLIATFHSIFASWPDNFFTFLECYPLVTRKEHLSTRTRQMTGLEHDFGTLYTRWLYRDLQDTAFSFLREAFADYLRQRYIGEVLTKRVKAFEGEEAKRLQERHFVTKQQAMETLGVGNRVLQSFLDQGLLRSQNKSIGVEKEKNIYFIEKDSLETLRQEWFDLLPLQTVAETIIGASEATVLTLQKAELLVPSQGSRVEVYTPNLRLYKKVDVERFVSDVLRRCIKGSSANVEGVYLTNALYITKLGLADMLTEILKGRLTPIDLGIDEPLLRRLMLSREELSRYIEEEEYKQREAMGLFTIDEGATLLGITRHVFSCYVRLGLLEREKLTINGRKSRILFRRQTLEAFRRTFVSQSEAAALLNLEMSTLYNYIHTGRLHPVHQISRKLLLFLRKEVELLAPPASLSLRQAASFLGITPRQCSDL
jgi:hypothetical protein